jgi:hypothetical protein
MVTSDTCEKRVNLGARGERANSGARARKVVCFASRKRSRCYFWKVNIFASDRSMSACNGRQSLLEKVMWC